MRQGRQVDQQQGERTALELPGNPESVQVARSFVRRTLDAWNLSALADTVVLLVSELATNALLHARSSYAVVLERSEAQLRVTVLDDSAAGPHRRHHGLRAATGRGLGLVETLARSWGSTPEGELGERAKGVWFEVPTDAADLPDGDEGALYGGDWLAQLDDL